MRVILNGVSALKPKTGVGHTTAYLHRALRDLAGEGDSFWLYPGDDVSRSVSNLLRAKPAAPARVNAIPCLRRGRWKVRLTELAKAAYRESFRVAARWGNFDLYHEPNFVPIPTHLPTVVTVHDLSVVLHPEWHPDDRVKFHDKYFHAGIAAAEHVIVVSEAVRREMIRLLGFPPDRVSAIHNGIGEQYEPQPRERIERLGLPPRYFLTVGTIEPRKNLLTVLKAFCDLPAEVRSTCPLVLAGGWGWKSGPEHEQFESEAMSRGAIHLGYVADDDLPALYSGAAALLYPSFYEGFGLPVAEMLACGGAVIASNDPAVREVAGRHAPILEPLDVAAWRDAMLRTVREPEWLDSFREGGMLHARRFTWSHAAERTQAVYRRVLGVESGIKLPTRHAA